MKYEEIITSLQTQYHVAIIRMRKGIIEILKKNGGMLDMGEGDYDTTVITMWDGNGIDDDVRVKSIELIGDETIYVNGISELNGDEVSHEAFNDHLIWVLDFIQIWDNEKNN